MITITCLIVSRPRADDADGDSPKASGTTERARSARSARCGQFTRLGKRSRVRIGFTVRVDPSIGKLLDAVERRMTSGPPTVIGVGGAVAVGKSTVAQAMATG